MNFFLYCIVGITVTAVCQRVVYKNYPLSGERPRGESDVPPRMVLSCLTGVMWPVALCAVLPVVVCYKLVNKAIDKILKV